MTAPTRTIHAAAPCRIADIGGWTDTWFARRGAVLNVAVEPANLVQVRARPRQGDEPQVVIHATVWRKSFTIDRLSPPYEHDPIVEAAIALAAPPDDLALEVTVDGGMPDGAATGSSGSIIVAVLAAVERLTPVRRAPHEWVRLAHRVETELLNEQAGVQDPIAAVSGGATLIDVPRYPEAVWSRLRLDEPTLAELDRRLMLVYVGEPHDSSAVHRRVIERLGGEAEAHPSMRRLRELAGEARDALGHGDLAAFGRTLCESHDAQAELDDGIVEPRHRRVIDIAREHGVVGWKVNGAGGRGGSMTLLLPPEAERRAILADSLIEADEGFQVVPVRLARQGVQVWDAFGTAESTEDAGAGMKDAR